jgi:hypothetical protein
MSLSADDVKKARYWRPVKVKIPYTAHPEHLPVDFAILPDGQEAKDKWNEIVEFLALATEQQPFADPYFWQSHEKASFARWLRSWKS